jgi:arylsulfatase A-like enzyme
MSQSSHALSIAPTILDFFDVLKPATYEGRSALSFLQKAKAVG